MTSDATTHPPQREVKPFVPHHPGESPVRCGNDQRIIATVVDFKGHVRAKCQSCKQWWHWSDAVGLTRSTSQRMMRPAPCDACGACVVVVSLSFSGTVYARCRACRAENKVTGVEHQRHPLAGMDQESFMHLMETRWLALLKEFGRRRAEVAVGLRFDVFKRDDFRCRYCGRSASDGIVLHADHVIPQSKGGPTALENLVTACFDCNIGKSAKDIDQSRMV